jgi:hypothetical protein
VQSAQHRLRPRASGRGAAAVRTLSVVVEVCVALARGRGAVVVLVRAVSVATAIVAVDSTPQPQWLSRLALLLANSHRQRPTSHTIVEAHPDVLARMARDGWPERYTIPTMALRPTPTMALHLLWLYTYYGSTLTMALYLVVLYLVALYLLWLYTYYGSILA